MHATTLQQNNIGYQVDSVVCNTQDRTETKGFTRFPIGLGYAVASLVQGVVKGFFAIILLIPSYFNEAISQKYTTLKEQSICDLKGIFKYTAIQVPPSVTKAARQVCENWQVILSNAFDQDAVSYLNESLFVNSLAKYLAKSNQTLDSLTNDLLDNPDLVKNLGLSKVMKAAFETHFNSLNAKKEHDLRNFWNIASLDIPEAKPEDLKSQDGQTLESALTALLHKSSRFIKILNLKGERLAFLPKGLGKLRHLKALDLSDNHLCFVPQEIKDLTSLRSLHLKENQLLSLPPEIGDLENLKILYLCENQLSSLPPEIKNLKNLFALALQQNQLTSLPANMIKELPMLTILHLEDNPLDEDTRTLVRECNKPGFFC